MKKRILFRILSLCFGCLFSCGGAMLCVQYLLPVLGTDGADIIFEYDPSPYLPPSHEEEEDPQPLPDGVIRYRAGDSLAGSIQGQKEQFLGNDGLSSQVEAVPNIGYRFSMWSDGVTSAVREGDPPGQTLYALFDYIGLPELYITFEEEALNKETYIPGSLSVSNLPDRCRLLDQPLTLRGRGNASYGFAKKSFKLKFGEKVSFFGLGEAAKTWVLISNHTDKSLLRNYFAYTLQQRLVGLPYSFACTLTDVYVNGEYRGVYLACPQIEAGQGRVPINDVGGRKDIGFLLELDHYYKGEEGIDYVRIGDIPFSIKSEVRTEEQSAYLSEFLTRCDEAIRTGNREELEQLVDLPSLLDSYILECFTKNIDVGWSSFYLYIPEDGGKLTFGPCWDFDLSAGNDYRLDGGDFRGLYVGERRNIRQENLWYSALMEFDWFRQMAAERYLELAPVIRHTIIDVQSYAELNFAELEANFDVWDIFDRRISKEPYEVLQRKSYEEQLDYLFDWYKSRFYWLEKYFTSVLDSLEGESSGITS